MKSKAPLISLEQAQLLVMHLEQGEQAAADELLTAICAPNSGELLEKIGHPTVTHLVKRVSTRSSSPRSGDARDAGFSGAAQLRHHHDG